MGVDRRRCLQHDSCSDVEASDHIKEPFDIQGPPDLVVEILSPATSRKDRREEKALYERFGVREYLVIDPANETVERVVHVDGRYESPDVFGWDETMTMTLFPELELNLWEIFEKERVEAVNEPRPGYKSR